MSETKSSEHSKIDVDFASEVSEFMSKKSTKNVVINFRAPEELVQRMDAFIEKATGGQGGARSAFILKVIDEFLSRNKI